MPSFSLVAKRLPVPDGTALGLLYTPLERASSGPVIICVPAMGVSARYYEPVLRALWAAGLSAAAFDLRGNGASSVRASRRADFGYNEILTRDFPCAVNEVATLFPDRRLYIMGHSLGGQLACLYAATPGAAVAGVILVASGSVYFRNWTFPFNLLVLTATHAARITAGIFGYFPGRQLGFGGREARRVIYDWSAQARTGRYNVACSGTDYESALASMAKPILAITLEGDRLAPYPATQHLCLKMARATTDHRSIAASTIDARKRVHFRWARNPESVIAHVLTWLDGVGAGVSGREQPASPADQPAGSCRTSL